MDIRFENVSFSLRAIPANVTHVLGSQYRIPAMTYIDLKFHLTLHIKEFSRLDLLNSASGSRQKCDAIS